jgi:hypothetical protein
LRRRTAAQISKELGTVRQHTGAKLIEVLEGQAARIGRRLQHQRRNGTDQNCFGHALCAVPTDVTRDFAPTRRVTNVNGIPQVERLDQRREVVRVRVHVVTIPRLARSAVATAVVSDASVAAGGEKHHLVLPRICIERPPVAEDDRLPASPVLEIDPCAVFHRDGVHQTPSFATARRQGPIQTRATNAEALAACHMRAMYICEPRCIFSHTLRTIGDVAMTIVPAGGRFAPLGRLEGGGAPVARTACEHCAHEGVLMLTAEAAVALAPSEKR